MKSLLSSDDLTLIESKLETLSLGFKNAHFLITGATGFFGCWLLEALIYLNSSQNLNLKITAFTRDKNSFRKKYPHFFAYDFLEFVEFEISSSKNTEFQKGFTHIIHAASETNPSRIKSDPEAVILEGISGVKNTLEIAKNNPNSKYLFLSSGAVYGKQTEKASEENSSNIDLTKPESSYAEGKRIAELLSNFYFQKFGTNTKIARCFSFVGPYMKLDGHYAIGNFISNAATQKPIQINSDGSAVRSYLYTADLVIWLLTILEKGRNITPYNIGSDEEISILHLAELVKKNTASACEISVLKKSDIHNTSGSDFYVPNVNRARNELGLEIWTKLSDAIKKTYYWSTSSFS